MIIDPIGFKRAMLDAKHQYEVDMERSGWQPSPPIRAASSSSTTTTPSGPGPVADAPSAIAPSAPSPTTAPDSPRPAPVAPPATTPSSPMPASPATHRVNPDEVTRTLASLADLRDRGAISAEEYEAKKTDLLARL